jgi:hypothetical protein
MIQDFRAVIDRFGGVAAFADATGMQPNTAKVARQRNSLSVQWFAKVARVAEDRGLSDVTLERLAELAEERRSARVAA